MSLRCPLSFSGASSCSRKQGMIKQADLNKHMYHICTWFYLCTYKSKTPITKKSCIFNLVTYVDAMA